jgi:hypothetical protein
VIWSEPLFVIRSVRLAPVSLARVTAGGLDGVVSSVNVKGSERDDTLPARSVCRTSTVTAPGAGAKPDVHVAPLLTEYSIRASASMPPKARSAIRVILSVELEPVSVLSETAGVAGARVSRVKMNVLAAEMLPAASFWRTRTVLTPSTAVKVLPQLVPLLTEY